MARPDPNVPKLRDHVYDGIQEYDQRLPNWWLYTLYGAIVFSVIYWVFHFQSPLGRDDYERVEAEMQVIEARRLEGALSMLNDDTLWSMSRNPEWVTAGETLYAANCAVCHGANLGGGIGLALNTDTWKYGSEPTQMFQLVLDGSPDKASGMKSWANDLGHRRIAQVLAFVLSHHDPAAPRTVDPAKRPPGVGGAASGE